MLGFRICLLAIFVLSTLTVFANAEEKILVTDFAISTAIVNRSPSVRLGNEVSLTSKQLFFWNKIASPKIPTTIKHVWYLNDMKLGEVPLMITASPYRTWSRWNALWPGPWTVQVVDGAKIIKIHNFTVVWTAQAKDKPYYLEIRQRPQYQTSVPRLQTPSGDFSLEGSVIIPRKDGIVSICAPRLLRVTDDTGNQEIYRESELSSRTGQIGGPGYSSFGCHPAGYISMHISTEIIHHPVSLQLPFLPKKYSHVRASYLVRLYRQPEITSTVVTIAEGMALTLGDGIRGKDAGLEISPERVVVPLSLEYKLASLSNPADQLNVLIGDGKNQWVGPQAMRFEPSSDSVKFLEKLIFDPNPPPPDHAMSGRLTLHFSLSNGLKPTHLKIALVQLEPEDAVFTFDQIPNPAGPLD